MDNIANEILAFIGRNSEGATLYQIIRGYGFPDAPYDLQALLHAFVEERLAELRMPEAGVNAKYVVTEKGMKMIALEK